MTETNSGIKFPAVVAGRKGLARVTGSVVIALSALSQEYGSGINFVVPQGLGKYPGTENLVPLAIFIAGLVLIPGVVLFARYARVMPTAGASYVWLTRALGPVTGFATAFMWLIGLCGSIGFVAYVSATFVGDTLQTMGLPATWAVSAAGHLTIGLVAIWSLTALHCSGVKRYGRFIYVVGAIVFIVAAITIYVCFSTSPAVTAAKLTDLTNVKATSLVAKPSGVAFFSATALFIFSYGGLDGGASLGGEAANPARSMPRGIVFGWALALVLYTAVTFALFHAVPWGLAVSILKSGQGHVLTVPFITGILVSKPIAVFINILVTVVVIKTLAPQLLSASRYLYGWAEDGFIPSAVQSTNRFHVPALAVMISAVLGSLFLINEVFSGWEIGVAVRSFSLILAFTMLGVGILVLAISSRWSTVRSFSNELTSGAAIKAMAVAAVVIGLPLMIIVAYEPGTTWYLQPWFQVLVTSIASIGISLLARARYENKYHVAFEQNFLSVPEQ
ncbi:MAG: APC family permease [Gammaproteobacteria bacterium]